MVLETYDYHEELLLSFNRMFTQKAEVNKEHRCQRANVEFSLITFPSRAFLEPFAFKYCFTLEFIPLARLDEFITDKRFFF